MAAASARVAMRILDVVLSEGSQLVQPLDAAPLAAYERLAPDVRAFPVLRTTADAAGAGSSLQSATVLGVPHAALASMHWRSDYSRTPQPRLARLLAPHGGAALEGVRLPAGTATVRGRTRLQGTPLALGLVLRDARGRIARTSLGTAAPGRSDLAGRIPPSFRRGGELLGVELSLTPADSAWLFHLAHEERLVRAPHGVLSLRLAAARRTVALRHWVVGGPSAPLRARASAARIAYSFSDVRTLVLRPRQPTDRGPIPVIASPAVAAAAGPGGLLALNFYDPRLEARVVATARRFPTIPVGDEFVVADESALATALEADAPGTGNPGELWLSVPHHAETPVQRALDRPPFSRLDRVSRRRLVARAEHDPLARGVVAMLGVAALLALALAVIGLWATVASDIRDERDALFDLEAQGVGPETLRGHLRLRSLFLVAFGVLGGAVLGLVLSRLVVSLVQVTAAATAPDPPLVLDLGVGSLAIALAVLVAATLLVAEATTRRAFRHDVPERGSWSGE